MSSSFRTWTFTSARISRAPLIASFKSSSVLPPLRGLPLNARTFIQPPPQLRFPCILRCGDTLSFLYLPQPRKPGKDPISPCFRYHPLLFEHPDGSVHRPPAHLNRRFIDGKNSACL